MEQVMCEQVAIPPGTNLFTDEEVAVGEDRTQFGVSKIMQGWWEGGKDGFYRGVKVRYQPGRIRVGFATLEVPSAVVLNEAGQCALQLIQADKVMFSMARISGITEKLQQEIRPLEASRRGLILKPSSVREVETIVRELIGKFGILVTQLREFPALIETDTAATIKRLSELQVVEVERLGMGQNITWQILQLAEELSLG